MENGQTEILEAILAYAEKNDKQIGELTLRVGRLEGRLTNVEERMVTKDDLDLAKTEICERMLAVDKSVNARVDLLVHALDMHAVLTPAQTAQLLADNPFPQKA